MKTSHRQGTLCFILLFLVLATQAHANDKITLALAGDVMLGRGVEKKLAEGADVWTDVAAILTKADVTHINHEFVWTTATDVPTPKAFAFKADPQFAGVLTKAGIDSVSLANNHAFDFGVRGFDDTLVALDKLGILRSGAGDSPEAARAPSCLTTHGKKICFVSFTNNMPEWNVDLGKPGVFYLPILEKYLPPLLQAIRDTKKSGADVIVVSAHWGRNWDKTPPEGFSEFARSALDAGADVFHGHSGHVIQGVEWHAGKPIFYCMGDLIDDYAVQSGRNDLGYVATVTIGADAKILQAEIHPTKIVDRMATLAKGKDFKWVEKTLKDRSKGYGTVFEANGKIMITRP